MAYAAKEHDCHPYLYELVNLMLLPEAYHLWFRSSLRGPVLVWEVALSALVCLNC